MRTASHITSVPARLIYCVLGVMLLMLGVIGLVIPVIPGVIFLVAAIYVFGRVSSRVRRWSHRHPVFRNASTQFGRMGQVNVFDRLRVVSLMFVGVIARGLDTAAGTAARVLRRYR